MRVPILQVLLFTVAWLTLAWLCLGSQSFYLFMTNSDQMTLPSEVAEILQGRTFDIRTWMFSRAPYFFPDNLGLLAVACVVRSTALATQLYWTLHILALGAASWFIGAQVLGRNKAFLVSLFAAVIFCLLVVTMRETGLTDWRQSLWVLLPLSHASTVLTAIASFSIAEAALRRPLRSLGGLAWRAAFLVFGVLCVMSNLLFVAMFTLPYFLARFILGVRGGGNWVRPIFEFLLLQGIAIALAREFLSFFRLQIYPDTHVTIGIMQKTFFGLYGAFHWDKIFLFWIPMILLAVDAVRSLVAQRPREAAEANGAKASALLYVRSAFLCFMLFSALGSFAMTMLMSDGVSAGSLRYGVMYQFVGIVWLAVFLARTYEFLLRRSKSVLGDRDRAMRIGVGTAACAASLALIPVAYGTPGFVSAFDRYKADRVRARELQACKTAAGLKSGFAEYWTARKTWAASDWELQISPFEPGSVVAFYWGGNLRWFYQDARTGHPAAYNFVIADNISPPQRIEEIYGRPTRIMKCAGINFWIYDDEQALREAVLSPLGGEALKAGLADSNTPFFVSANSFHNQVGSRSAGLLKASTAADPGGYLAFGPYWTLPRGIYEVKFEGRCSGAQSGAIVDVTAAAGTTMLAQPQPFVCGSSGNIVHLDLQGDTPAVEFRILFQDVVDFSFEGISIRRMAN